MISVSIAIVVFPHHSSMHTKGYALTGGANVSYKCLKDYPRFIEIMPYSDDESGYDSDNDYSCCICFGQIERLTQHLEFQFDDIYGCNHFNHYDCLQAHFDNGGSFKCKRCNERAKNILLCNYCLKPYPSKFLYYHRQRRCSNRTT